MIEVKPKGELKQKMPERSARARTPGACRPGGGVRFVLQRVERHWTIKRMFPFLKVPTSYYAESRVQEGNNGSRETR